MSIILPLGSLQLELNIQSQISLHMCMCMHMFIVSNSTVCVCPAHEKEQTLEEWHVVRKYIEDIKQHLLPGNGAGIGIRGPPCISQAASAPDN